MINDDADQLTKRAQSGDRAAATELIGLFYQRIYAYHRRSCANDSDAADLTQRTFAKAWASLESFGARSQFSTWLHAIARHVYVDWCRQSRRFESRSEDWWQARLAADPDPAQAAAARDGAVTVYRAVDRLDPVKRETVHLHYYQGLSLSDTAEVLGIALSTVKHRLHEALDQIKRDLREPPQSEKASGL
jgi:RNA polymerase sigma-70 factor, ECF subfamily